MRKNKMRILIVTLLILGCFALVGMVEDPCTTEGLPANCMVKK